MKNDGTWTFFGINFLGDEETSKPYHRSFGMLFDTQNTGRQGINANIPGLYSLDITFMDPKNPVEYSDIGHIGTPFMNAFVRSVDYDWKYYFNSQRGTQLEIKIKTEILRKYYDEIGMTTTFVGPNGISNLVSITNNYTIPCKMWIPMKFKDIPLPEPSDALLISGLIGAAALSSKLCGNKISRT